MALFYEAVTTTELSCDLVVSKTPAVQPEVPAVPSLNSVPEPALRAGGGQEGGRGEGQGDQRAPAAAALPVLGLFLGQARLRGTQRSHSQGESYEESLLWRQQQGKPGQARGHFRFPTEGVGTSYFFYYLLSVQEKYSAFLSTECYSI